MVNLATGRGVANGHDSYAGIENVTAYGTDEVKLIGDSHDNRLVGSASSRGGEDSIFRGRGGNDRLIGEPGFGYVGPELFSGGKGHDRLIAGCKVSDFANRLLGGDGSDHLVDNCGRSIQSGGKGSDSLEGAEGTLLGQRGDDRLKGGGDKLLKGGPGVDIVNYRNGADRIRASLISNQVTSFYASSSAVDVLADIEGVIGTKGHDVLVGSVERDFLHGWAGDDVITGRKGDDHLRGGSEEDEIAGNKGSDSIFGGSGNDTLRGGEGGDSMHGDKGNDFLNGEGGRNTNEGGAGRDRCKNPSGSNCEN